MSIEEIDMFVPLKRKPGSGEEAHRMIIESLKKEIEEKQVALRELLDEDIKQKFINQWTPGMRTINIYDVE